MNNIIAQVDNNASCWCLEGTTVYWHKGTGQRHRLDGPAVIIRGGEKQWWVNGQRHRLDGPAVIWADGRQEWWVNDNNITDEVNEWMKKNNVSYPFDSETLTLFKLMFG